MTLRRLAGCLVALAVLLVWLHSLGMRMPYMDQVPVFDADCNDDARPRCGPASGGTKVRLRMWFSTPVAPRTIEAPVHTLYESWPPGSFVPIYLTALLLGIEPSVPMVNWINTCEHGLIALAAAFIAFNIALMNRLGKVASLLIAVGVSFPILLSRGPIYVFSQVYDVTSAVLVYTTAFLMLETLFYSVQSERDKRIITALQLVTISHRVLCRLAVLHAVRVLAAQPRGCRMSRRGNADDIPQPGRFRPGPRQRVHALPGLALFCPGLDGAITAWHHGLARLSSKTRSSSE